MPPRFLSQQCMEFAAEQYRRFEAADADRKHADDQLRSRAVTTYARACELGFEGSLKEWESFILTTPKRERLRRDPPS